MTLYMKFVSLRPKFIISFMIGVDLFSGAGGLSLGAEMAGVNIKYAVEYDKYAAETYAHNHKNIPILLKTLDCCLNYHPIFIIIIKQKY